MLLAATQSAGGSSGQFVATCTAAELVGHLVTITGAGPTVATVDIDIGGVAVGIIASKPSATSCVVQTSGELALGGVVAGADYFADVGGTIVAGRPADPVAGSRVLQVVGQGLDTGVLLVGLAAQPVVATGSFVLTDVADLVAWYRADKGIGLDGITGNVATWADQSATGDIVAAPTVTAQPGYLPAVAALNGHPALLYASTGPADPLNQALSSAGTLLTAAHTTTFVVAQLTSSVGLAGPVMVADSSITPRMRCLDTGSGLRWEIATGPSLEDGLVDTSVPHLVVGEFGATGIIRLDGVQTASGPLATLQYDGISIGSGPPATPPTYSWNGLIAEVAIYNRPLLPAEIANIEAALMARYAL